MNHKLRAIQAQLREMRKDTSMMPFMPVKDSTDMWHVSFLGARGTVFENGIYHCALDLSQYPDNAPYIIMINDSGAYQTNTLICIAGVTSFHQSEWTAGTQIYAVIEALRAYMAEPTDRSGLGFINPLDLEQCKKLTKISRKFECTCGCKHAELCERLRFND